MTKRLTSLASVILLALGLVAFTGSALTGSALAGNGNGNGNGNDKAASPTAPAAEQPVTQASAPGGSGKTPPGQAKKDASASGQASSQTNGSAAQNANAQPGVKPTNATAKGATCSTGGGQGSSATCKATGTATANVYSASKADASKKYGNGKTAAQIANSRGAPAGTTVYGPGNSQPHKVWDCRKHHFVDVHAVKSYSTAACTSSTLAPAVSATATRSGSNTTVVGTSVSAKSSNGTSVGSSTKSNSSSSTGSILGTVSSGKSGTAKDNTPAGGVLGVTASVGSSKPAGGVLGAVASGTLPFTGFPLWLAVLAAAALIVLGLALLRRGRATV